MSSHQGEAVTVATLILEAAGFILLSALVVTVSLSDKLDRRNPVFKNFLFTWILSSAWTIFEKMAILAGRDIGDDQVFSTQEFGFLTMTTTATLNLSIHLWWSLPTKQSSPRTKMLRTLFLVIGPYVLSLVSLPNLFLSDDNGWIGTMVVCIFWIPMQFTAIVLDIIILIKYWRYNHKMRDTLLRGVVSLPFFFRLLGLALYQLLYSGLLISGFFESPEGLVKTFAIVNSSFPLFAFCVLGLHTEILCLWFPCVWRPRKFGTKEIVGENSAPMVDTHPSNNSEAMAQYLPVGRSENGEKDLASV